MHLEKSIANNNAKIACFIIVIVSFFSINSLPFNPAYIFISAFIFFVILVIFIKGRCSSFSSVTFIFSFVFLGVQFVALRSAYLPLVIDGHVNYLSPFIFILSSMYAVVFYEFFRQQSVASRLGIYKWSGGGVCFYLLLELISRLLIGDVSGGVLYGFKKSLFYFDSNFTGLIILSFIMFFIYIRNIGRKGVDWIIFMLFIMLILTMSRAAMAAAVLGVGIFYSHKNYKWKSYCALLSYIFIFILLSYVYIFEDVNFLDIDGSFNSKFYIVRKAVELYEVLPLVSILFGIGLGNFDTYTGIFAHNIFVTMVLEMGIIGSLLFASFIIYSVVRSKGSALYIWLPTLVCGISLFGVYSPYLFLINAAILLESEK